MEGLISQGHLGQGVEMRGCDDRSSSAEPAAVSGPASARIDSSTKSGKKMSSTPNTSGTPDRGGPSKAQTWKDKPGMAKKRKAAKKQPGWEIVEVDDDDEEVISSGRDVVLGPRPSTSGLKGKSNGGESSRRTVIYDIDSSDDGSSESAVVTDEEDYEEVESSKKRGKKKQVEPVKPQKQKGKKGKGKAKKRTISEDPDLQDIALSSIDNSVFVIDAILGAEYGTYGESNKQAWMYTIKWHGYTIEQTMHEEPIPAMNFGGDGSVIKEFWGDLEIPTSSTCITWNDEGYVIHEPTRRPGVILASPRSLVKWHMSAYRRYKEDSLRFVKQLRRLEGEGTRLDKATVEEIHKLKRYKAEVRRHMEDARREIDINQRACRAARLQTPDPDEIEEVDIDTDEALGEQSSTDDAISPPKKKRKTDYPRGADNRPSTRPVPKHKVRPEEQKAKNAFKARVLQEDPRAKTGIVLKIPRKSLSPEVLKQRKEARPAPPKSPEKVPKSVLPKSPEKVHHLIPPRPQAHDGPPKSRPQERPIEPSSAPPAPADPERPMAARPKPRRRAPQSTGSPSKESAKDSSARPAPRDTAPEAAPASAPIAPREVSPPLFLDPPDPSRRIRQSQWALGADTPSPVAARSIRTQPPTGLSVDEGVTVDGLSSPVPSASMAVKPEPKSPGGYSDSEGEIEHDLGLDAELNEPNPEPILFQDDPPPRPVKTGVTFHLRFDNELIGQRNIGKVRLENISDPQNLGDPLAMFESLFYGGEKELVVDQAIMDADKFLMAQKVNQFARIRPENPESRAEINRLTILMQDKRQPLGVVRVRENLLIVIYSSKSTHSARLSTPRDIRASAGFTMAALFPTKDFSVHVNPTVRAPMPLPPRPLTIPTPQATVPDSVTSAQATSAVMVPPLTVRTSAGLSPGVSRALSALMAADPVELSPMDATESRDKPTGADMDIELDMDVDLGLDMDLDPVNPDYEEKPRVSPEVVRAVVTPTSRPEPVRVADARPVPPVVTSAPVPAEIPQEDATPIQPVESPSRTSPSRSPARPEVSDQLPDTLQKQNEPEPTSALPPPLVEASVVASPISAAPWSTKAVGPPHAEPIDPATEVARSTNAPDEIVTPASLPTPVAQPETTASVVSLAAPKEQDEARGMIAEEPVTNAWPEVDSTVPEPLESLPEPPPLDSPEIEHHIPEPMDIEQEVVSKPLPSAPLPLSSPPPIPESAPPPSPSPKEVLPAPPLSSPPPLPDSPVPVVSHTPPPPDMPLPDPTPATYVPTVDDSLPVIPPVPVGGGRMQLEVFIDEDEFENSAEGYFRRFMCDFHPDDLHPNNELAAYGFTKQFAAHLLCKRCVITSTVAKDDLKQLVIDAAGTPTLLGLGADFDIMLVSNDLYPKLAEAQVELGFASANREVWSFGPADDLEPQQWRLKRHWPKRSGLVSFCAQAIIKSPDLFLDCLRKIHELPNWNSFLSVATIRAIHHYMRHASTPQTLRIKMFRTMNDATGLFQVRYPRNTDTVDRMLRERQQQVVRSVDNCNRWVDLQQALMKNESLIVMGDLCAKIPPEKMPPSERKYWERDSEILNELDAHQTKMDEIYAVKRSIFAGFDYSSIRKGLGDDAIAELGFDEVEGYRMEELLRDLSRDIMFAGLLLPSERMSRERE